MKIQDELIVGGDVNKENTYNNSDFVVVLITEEDTNMQIIITYFKFDFPYTLLFNIRIGWVGLRCRCVFEGRLQNK